MVGKIIFFNDNINDTKFLLDASNYEEGIYMVLINTKNGSSFIKKLVKN